MAQEDVLDLLVNLRNEARRVDQVVLDLSNNPSASVVREAVQVLRGVSVRLRNYRPPDPVPRPLVPPLKVRSTT